MKTIHYTTEDKRTLEADLYDAGGDRWAILMHMMPATKSSYKKLAEALVKKGISCLAFDQRGHGESQGGPDAYKSFTDFEHVAKTMDVEASIQYLLDEEFNEEKMILVGASIGANLAIATAVGESKIPAVVALSPGLDYRGIVVEDSLRELEEGQKFLIVASKEDEYSALSAKRIHQSNDKQSKLIMKEGLGHGTAMLDADDDLLEEVVRWIDKHV